MWDFLYFLSLNVRKIWNLKLKNIYLIRRYILYHCALYNCSFSMQHVDALNIVNATAAAASAAATFTLFASSISCYSMSVLRKPQMFHRYHHKYEYEYQFNVGWFIGLHGGVLCKLFVFLATIPPSTLLCLIMLQ